MGARFQVSPSKFQSEKIADAADMGSLYRCKERSLMPVLPPRGGHLQIFNGARIAGVFNTLADAGMQITHACGTPATPFPHLRMRHPGHARPFDSNLFPAYNSTQSNYEYGM